MLTRTLSEAFWGLALMLALGAGGVTAWLAVGGAADWWHRRKDRRRAIERVISERFSR